MSGECFMFSMWKATAFDICISYIAFNKMYVWRIFIYKSLNTSCDTTLTICVLYIIKKRYKLIIWANSSSYTTRPLEVLLLSGSQREDLRRVCEMRGWNAAAGTDLCSVAVWINERWIVALQSHSTCSSGSIRSRVWWSFICQRVSLSSYNHETQFQLQQNEFRVTCDSCSFRFSCLIHKQQKLVWIICLIIHGETLNCSTVYEYMAA